jgi:hypothetical protein
MRTETTKASVAIAGLNMSMVIDRGGLMECDASA